MNKTNLFSKFLMQQIVLKNNSAFFTKKYGQY